MKAVRLSRNLLVVIALVVSLAANVTLFVGGVVYSVVDEFVDRAFGLTTAAATQRRALAVMKKKNVDLQTAKRKLRGQLGNVRHVVASTAERSRTRLLRSAKRSVATLPGKALPYAGAAVVAAVTAMEIKDLCATMQDMDRIKRATGAPQAGAESEPTVCSVPVPSVEQVLALIEDSAKEAWGVSKKFVPDLPTVEGIRGLWPDGWRGTWDGLKRLLP